MMKNKYTIFILTCVMAVLLPSCVSSDPAYQQLEAQYDRNPSSNAIVGAWRRPDNGHSVEKNMNLLFRKSGKGISYATDLVGSGESVSEFTWKYVGNGIWISVLWDFKAEIKITKDKKKLLIKQSGLGGVYGSVYTRQ